MSIADRSELAEGVVLKIERLAENATNILYPVFQQFGWTWFDSDEPPTRKRIEDKVVAFCLSVYRHLIEQCPEQYQTYAESGRIRVICERDELDSEPQDFEFRVYLETGCTT